MPPQITFDAFTLAAVVAEIRPRLPCRVQKVQQPAANELILSLYGARAWRLLLSADPRQYRIHETQQKRENPTTPPGFCQVCRKYLDGAALYEVKMPRFDRILHLNFQAHDGERVSLIAELMGRNSNVILVSGSNIVRGAMRIGPADAARTLRPGTVYEEPPGLDTLRDAWTVQSATDPIFAELPEDVDGKVALLSRTFAGLGKFGAAEIVALADAEFGGDVGRAFHARMDAARAGRFAPHSIADADGNTVGVAAFAPLTIPSGRRFPRESISVALDTLYATMTRQEDETSGRQTLAKALTREIAFREKDLHSQRTTIAEAARADGNEQIGNNLLASLSAAKRGDTSVTVPDLYNTDDPNATITITLDPRRSPHENAEAYFDRARKSRDAADYAEGRAADRESELEELRALEVRLGAETTDEGLDAIRAALAEIVGAARAAGSTPGQAAKKDAASARPFGGHKIRRFTVDGFELLIGESAEANDYLTTRVAAPSDWWMHVRSAPGAHGVLRANGQPTRVPEAVIRRAAAIVAARSGTSVKHAGVVAVDVVEKRHVRKPRGAKAGLVTYQRERVLDVSPEGS